MRARRCLMVAGVVLGLAGGTEAAAAAVQGGAAEVVHEIAPPDLQRVRELYFAAVQSSDALAVAEREVRRRIDSPSTLTEERAAILTAYSGALRTLRAKHGRWPPARLRDLQHGLSTMDDVIARFPDLAEIRYLRLMSCYYLPSLFGRSESVREDFSALARLLPSAKGELSPELYAAVARFVLENGKLTAAQRAPLERSLVR